MIYLFNKSTKVQAIEDGDNLIIKLLNNEDITISEVTFRVGTNTHDWLADLHEQTSIHDKPLIMTEAYFRAVNYDYAFNQGNINKVVDMSFIQKTNTEDVELMLNRVFEPVSKKDILTDVSIVKAFTHNLSRLQHRNRRIV